MFFSLGPVCVSLFKMYFCYVFWFGSIFLLIFFFSFLKILVISIPSSLCWLMAVIKIWLIEHTQRNVLTYLPKHPWGVTEKDGRCNCGYRLDFFLKKKILPLSSHRVPCLPPHLMSFLAFHFISFHFGFHFFSPFSFDHRASLEDCSASETSQGSSKAAVFQFPA